MKPTRTHKPGSGRAGHGWRCCPATRGTQTLFGPRPWPSPTATTRAAAPGGEVRHDGGQP